jgi:hypothetical protein
MILDIEPKHVDAALARQNQLLKIPGSLGMLE